MDAVSHPETQAHLRNLRGHHAAKVRAVAVTPVQQVKQMAMHAIANVETVAQVGLIRLTGGIALYAARIREADRDAQRDAGLRNLGKAQNNKSQDLVRD
jgi:hypothetical protein